MPKKKGSGPRGSAPKPKSNSNPFGRPPRQKAGRKRDQRQK